MFELARILISISNGLFYIKESVKCIWVRDRSLHPNSLTLDQLASLRGGISDSYAGFSFHNTFPIHQGYPPHAAFPQTTIQ